jgi:hypothetical protein
MIGAATVDRAAAAAFEAARAPPAQSRVRHHFSQQSRKSCITKDNGSWLTAVYLA